MWRRPHWATNSPHIRRLVGRQTPAKTPTADTYPLLSALHPSASSTVYIPSSSTALYTPTRAKCRLRIL